MRKLFTLLSSAALLFSMAGSALAAAPARNDAAGSAAQTPKVDNLPSPLAEKQSALKQAALEKVMKGTATATGKNKVVKMAPGQYVELARQGEDTIWTVLGDFGTQVNPTYGGTPGPVNNEIPQPDRTVDNSTIWAPDFNQAYYQDMLFSEAPGAVSMRNFYLEQSSNRYTVNGTVEDWVTVPYNEANYGANYCGGIVCARTWLFVRDAVNAWYNGQIAAGKTPAEIDTYLASLDVWDRYDYNHNGNFNEPDGYIDHFQAVHAGEGEETGGGAQGSDAIWSHRWYAYYNNIGSTGPAFNQFGGIQIGNSGKWIGDYTVEPENGGVGVFSHEFGHDLGLPDLYDTSGNTGGAENSVGFWSLYSSGSYGSTGIPADGIGSKPISMSVYEKIFLGWSDYAVVSPGQHASVKLSGAVSSTKQHQAIVALLPDKAVDFVIGPPASGSQYYYSGSGDNLDHSMTRLVTLPSGTVGLTAKVRYNIETGWDYAYLTVDGTPVHTNLSTSADPNGQNFGEGITGVSPSFGWVDLTADLTAYAGQTVTLGFRYWTDGAQQGEPGAGVPAGIGIDDIAVTGQALDGAEADAGWTFVPADGFKVTTGTDTFKFFNAYFAEYRNYRGYDDGLRTGPYNFGYLNDPALGNWVDHFPYQDGLLVWYYDTSFDNNNIGDHCLSGRCGGLYLPVDAHPDLLIRPDNSKVWRARVQSYDSTFGLEKTDKITMHMNSVPQTIGGLKANPMFNDMNSYWVAPDTSIGNNGWFSVIVPHTGTTMRVLSTSNNGNFMQVVVN